MFLILEARECLTGYEGGLSVIVVAGNLTKALFIFDGELLIVDEKWMAGELADGRTVECVLYEVLSGRASGQNDGELQIKSVLLQSLDEGSSLD